MKVEREWTCSLGTALLGLSGIQSSPTHPLDIFLHIGAKNHKKPTAWLSRVAFLEFHSGVSAAHIPHRAVHSGISQVMRPGPLAVVVVMAWTDFPGLAASLYVLCQLSWNESKCSDVWVGGKSSGNKGSHMPCQPTNHLCKGKLKHSFPSVHCAICF